MKLKRIGNLLLIVSIIFIAVKLKNFNLDYQKYFEPRNILIILMAVLINFCAIWMVSSGWIKIITYYAGDKEIDNRELRYVYMHTNLAKYIPGNVMQFVGRNILASKYEIPQQKVVVSTLMDILMLILASCFIIVFMNPVRLIGSIVGWQYLKLSICIIAVVLVAGICILFFKRQLVKKYISDGRVIVKKCILNYVLCMLFTGCSFLMIMFIFKTDLVSSIPLIIGAFVISWLIGFITPGASGGIGVREAILIMILGKIMTSNNIIEAVLLHRVVSVIADVSTYLFCLALRGRVLWERR